MTFKVKSKAIKKIGDSSYSINLKKIKSDDPLAYAYGYIQGKEGKQMPKDKDLAIAYKQGYKKGYAERYTEKYGEYELKPVYDSRKSFYGKAKVRKENGRLILTSYNTDVAELENGKAYVYGTYSPTTLRHIKEFLKQYGYKAESSKQIIKDYGEGI
jgi:hypothetical protein